ncbi:MAG: hypothetical protein AAGA60_29905 [Cyanobacteria bacterium P01_E01_bin.42]
MVLGVAASNKRFHPKLPKIKEATFTGTTPKAAKVASLFFGF